MKTLALIGLVLVIGMSSCDKVDRPFKTGSGTSNLPTSAPTYVTTDSTTMNVYKLLLEDCTAHFCTNCPTAAADAEALMTTYGNKIVMMQDNMGALAYPPGSKSGILLQPGIPSYAYANYYVCDADSAWDAYFGISAQGLPQGMINRADYTGAGNGSVTMQDFLWTDTVSAFLAAHPTPQATINIVDSCWVPQRIIGTAVTVNFKTALSGNYQLELVIIQDSIIDWQTNGGSQKDSTFVHRNVLRGAFNYNPWGDPIASNPSAGSSFTKYYSYDFVKGENGKAASWNMANCYVVAFVYNAATYRVVQADMVRIE
jgi:hypothetical protein